MIVKKAKKHYIVETLYESIKVEKEMAILKNNQGDEDKEETITTLVNKVVQKPKPILETKDKDSIDMDNLHRIIKKLSDKIIDLKKGYR